MNHRNRPLVPVPPFGRNWARPYYAYIARGLWDLREVDDSVFLHIHDTIQILFQQDHHVIETIGNLTDLVRKLRHEFSADRLLEIIEAGQQEAAKTLIQEILNADWWQHPPLGPVGTNNVLAQGFSRRAARLNSVEFALKLWLFIGTGRKRSADAAQIIPGEELYQWIPDWFRQPLEVNEAHPEAEPGLEPEVNNDELHAVIKPLLTIQSFISTILLWQGPQGAKDFDYDCSFPAYFTLRDLNLMGRFYIRWTNNILSHLRVVRYRDDHFRPTLYVFQQARVLERLAINGPDWYRPVAEEALLTMGLLVPMHGVSPKWFDYCCRNNQKNVHQPGNRLPKFVMAALLWGQPWLPPQLGGLLPPCNIDLKVNCQSARLQTRRVGEFRIFQRRLLALREDFDNTSPWSVSAWWYDKRKGREAASFWATICSFLFTLVALLLAAVSTLIAILLASEANDYARTGNSLASLANNYASNASTDAAKTAEAVTTFTTIHITGTTNYISSNINQINNSPACLAASLSCSIVSTGLEGVAVPELVSPAILARETGSRALLRAISAPRTPTVVTPAADHHGSPLSRTVLSS
ncbi:hypothetical protein SAMD00023353_6900560 [Rosellinia necatrix]|uniref:Uncharacterized protein n=1 Tax=Rosellinia necatrix TaxID=77044 RepID=A0A1W2TT19_ROSNE|nr:hypothetical protein SAMD00023353_6900560 [Rosellinia necatrix]